MAAPAPRRRRARVARDETPDDDDDDDDEVPSPPPRFGASVRWIIVPTVAAVAFVVGVKYLLAQQKKHETEAALVDSLMPLPVDRADCERWGRHDAEVFAKTAALDRAADRFDRLLIDDDAHMALSSCLGALEGHRIPKEAYLCLSNETDFGLLVRCREEARKAAR